MIFANVCKIPFEGSHGDPRPRDMVDFIFETTMGETRGVSEERVASLHFLLLRYYALYVGRCLTSWWESGSLSVSGLAILRQALYDDRTFSLGVMVARWLLTNRSKGVIYGGIYASRLAEHFEIPIRHEEAEERWVPTKYLDYTSMVACQFIDNDKHKHHRCNLVFCHGTREIITLPAPSLFDLYSGRYTIMPDDIYTYWGLIQPPVPEPAPVPEPCQKPVYQ